MNKKKVMFILTFFIKKMSNLFFFNDMFDDNIKNSLKNYRFEKFVNKYSTTTSKKK